MNATPQAPVEPKTPPVDKIECVVKDGVLKPADLPKAYLEFRKDIDVAGLQSSSATQTKKGYDTLGYGYAWITERLNDVIGPNCWRIIPTEVKHVESKSKNGNTMHSVSIDVALQLGNWKTNDRKVIRKVTSPDGTIEETEEVINAVEFDVLAAFVGYGWHKALSLTDARKGALTNGLKKAAGMFGVGNDAYKKNIDEENQEVQDALKKKGGKAPSKAPAPGYAPSVQRNFDQLNKALESYGAKTNEEKTAFINKYTPADFELKLPWDKMTPKLVNYLLVVLKNNASNLPPREVK